MDIMSSPTHDFQLPLRIVDNSLGRLRGSSTSHPETYQWSPTLAQRPAISHQHPAPATDTAPGQALSKPLNLSADRDASLVMPESQGHWEAKKQIIRRLYLIENRPLKELRDLMMRRHAFYATERMYKRQFLKWGWKKYNTKGLQDGVVERPPGKATCKRPARRRVLGVFANEDVLIRIMSNLPVMLNHGSDLDRMKHAIFTSQRDLIRGTLRRDPEWTTRDRFNMRKTPAHDVKEMVLVASNLIMVGDLQRAGAAFRLAFRSLETVIDDEPITFFDPLFFDIPYCIQDYELRVVYLRHLYQFLEVKRPREPVTLIATTMSKLEAEAVEYEHLYDAMEEMHRIKRDLYTEILGEYDLRSLHWESFLIDPRYDTNESLRRCKHIFRNYELLLASTIEQLGQFSIEAFDVELRQIETATLLAPLSGFVMILYNKYLDRVGSATGDKPIYEWKQYVLEQYQFIKRRIGLFQIRSGDVEAGITNLKDSIIAEEYVMLSEDDEDARLSYVRDILEFRQRLTRILDMHGRHDEADEVRAVIASSEYLEIVMQNDLGENFEEYVSLLC